MRIISKYNDYYDSVQMYGQDHGIVYVRNESTMSKDDDGDLFGYIENYVKYSDKYFYNRYMSMDTKERHSIFFCGERFNVIEVEDTHNRKIGESAKKLYFYDFDSLYDYYEKLINSEKLNRPKHVNKSEIQRIKDFFNNKKTSIDLHFKMDCPIFIMTNKHMERGRYKKVFVKNPCLKTFDFAKIKDPYSAYQELDMFISGVMGGRSPVMVDISDEDMKKQKGFDNYSFKTLPTKRKQK